MTISVNHEQLKEHIYKSYNTGISLFVKGTMGIGKSDTIKQTAKDIAKEQGLEFIDGDWAENKFGFIDMRLSQYSPEDLKGLPMFNQKEKTTEWLLPDVLPRGGKGVIFFDELNLAPQSIQASAYQLILDRRLGKYKIPDGWAIISAGNGVGDKASVYDLPAPLSNRFTHVQLTPPSVDSWTNWATQKDINNNIITFLQFKQNYLFTYNEENDDSAFGTPRSWAFCSKLIEGEKDEKSILRYVASAVGEGIAREYIAFHKMANEVDIDKIIKYPNEFISPKDVNIKYAIAGALADRYKSNSKLLSNICKVWGRLDAEFSVVSMKMCKAYKPQKFISDLMAEKEWVSLSKEYGKYLK